MKKTLGSMAAAAALALAFTAAASAKDTGPKCTNYTGGDGVYSTFGGTEAFVSWGATTEDPTCAQATYTLYVLTASGGSLLASESLAGGTSMACPDSTTSSTSCVHWTIDLGAAATAPSSVCIYGTSTVGTKVDDRAPDNNCIALVLNSTSSGGGTGFD